MENPAAVHSDLVRILSPARGGAVAGLFVIMVPIAMMATTHDSRLVAYVIGAYNAGLLPSPAWGLLAERSKNYRPIF